MKTFLLSVVFAFTSNTLLAQIGVVSPDEAITKIETAGVADQPLILDTRGGYKDYFRGHLPRAHHLNFDTLRGTDHGVPVQYLPDDLTRALLVRAGVHRDRTHFVYATGDTLPSDEILSASMVAYVLEKFGVQDIRIIDGGLADWETANLPVTQEYFGNQPGVLPTEMARGLSIAINEIVKLRDSPTGLLVDARPRDEYLGEDDVWLRKGHIPGAISFHWARLMDTDNTHRFRPSDEVDKDLRAAGITPDKDIVVYCGTSREGSLLRFYLRHVAKYPKVRLYEGSWKEYASLSHLPTETIERFAVGE